MFAREPPATACVRAAHVREWLTPAGPSRGLRVHTQELVEDAPPQSHSRFGFARPPREWLRMVARRSGFNASTNFVAPSPRPLLRFKARTQTPTFNNRNPPARVI